jgi:hypothetical protein
MLIMIVLVNIANLDLYLDLFNMGGDVFILQECYATSSNPGADIPLPSIEDDRDTALPSIERDPQDRTAYQLKFQNRIMNYHIYDENDKRVLADAWYKEGRENPYRIVRGADPRDASTFNKETFLISIIKQYDSKGVIQAD